MNFKGSYIFYLNNHNFELHVNFKKKICRGSENMLKIEIDKKLQNFQGVKIFRNLQKMPNLSFLTNNPNLFIKDVCLNVNK